MKCTNCEKTIRISKEKYYDQLKMCLRCYKAYMKLGKNLKKVVY
jgi:hypothetical protein